MINGIDHFALVVNDLDAAVQTHRRLGFDAQAGGEHPAFGSHNALIALADGAYLELVGFKNIELASKAFWRDAVKRLHASEGLDNFVLLSNDLASDVSNLRARGLVVSEPEDGSRVRPDGQRVAFRIATLGGTRSGLLPFLIQDDTPRELRIEPASEGLGRRARVKQILIAAKDLDSARETYRALLGAEPKRVRSTTGDLQGFRFSMPWGALVVAHPEREANAMADQLSRRGEGLYAITLRVENLNHERNEMKSRGVKIEEDENGFLISPDATCGARIRLVQGEASSGRG